MKLHVSFDVPDKEWGPINGFIIGKVSNLDVTNAVAAKASVNGNGEYSGPEMLLGMIKKSAARGISGTKLFEAYEESGRTRAAAYQALTVMVKKGVVSKNKDGVYRPRKG